jgi:molecular chaperone HtpG
MLQHDRQLKLMAKAIEKKIKSELEKLLRDSREDYEKFFDAFGLQLKFGLYSDYGMHKDTLSDLVLFKSSLEKKYVTLKEYIERMKEDQKNIYYATGESIERIELLPRLEAIREKGFEVLYLTDEVDEFALKMLGKYMDKEFKNISAEIIELENEDDKAKLQAENDVSASLLSEMKDAIGEVNAVRFTTSLKKHAVCLTSDGELSLEMEKTLKKMPGATDAPKASVALEINLSHPITEKLKKLYESDKETLRKYSKMLYSTACLLGGIELDNPGEFAELISELMI